MIVNLYSIRDVLNGYAGIFTEVNDDCAIRGFKMSLRDASVYRITSQYNLNFRPAG